MAKGLLTAAVVALYLLHQDYWYWQSARPLVFGILPIGLFYHAIYSLVVAGLMWALVQFAWPSHLDPNVDTSKQVSSSERKP